MKVNFNKKLIGLDDKPMMYRSNPSETEREMTLRDVCVDAVVTLYRGEEDLPGKKRYERFELARKIKRAGQGDTELTVEEVVTIKEVVAKAFAPAVLGPIYEALEGGAEPTLKAAD